MKTRLSRKTNLKLAKVEYLISLERQCEAAEKFETIINSYWDSLPENMQQELTKYYDERRLKC